MFPPVPLLVIAGFSGSGKTTFIEKFIPALIHRNYSPGYIKRAGGHHALDIPGKDSYRQLAAGASFSMVFTQEKWAMHQRGTPDEIWACSESRTDLVLLEGFKKSEHPKIVCVHPQETLPEELDWENGDAFSIAKVLAYLTVGATQAHEINETVGQTIAFQRDALDAITDHVLQKLDAHYHQVFALKGAVMIGGKSTRMGADKAWLEYGQGPHAHYLFEMLSQHPSLQAVIYSGTPLTEPPPGISETTIVKDRFLNFGPLGGILTLFETDPQAAWFVLACDLAQLRKETIDYLLAHRNPLKAATVFVNDQDRFEPLAAVYEPRMGLHLKRSLLYGVRSFQKIFPQVSIQRLPIPQFLQAQLSNVNTPQEREQTLRALETGSSSTHRFRINRNDAIRAEQEKQNQH